jgi:hypothetical protein
MGIAGDECGLRSHAMQWKQRRDWLSPYCFSTSFGLNLRRSESVGLLQDGIRKTIQAVLDVPSPNTPFLHFPSVKGRFF